MHVCHSLDGIRIRSPRCAREEDNEERQNRSSAGAVDCCSLPGSQPMGCLGGGQVRCSGESHSPPEEREIDFPEKK